MSLINPMRQALEALDTALFWLKDADLGTTYVAMQKRAEALRQVIGQAEKMEPFGIWHQGATEEESDFFLFKDAGDVSCPDCIKLYTNPPTETLTTEMLIDAALSASAAGLLSGTTNWAAYVLQYLKGESL